MTQVIKMILALAILATASMASARCLVYQGDGTSCKNLPKWFDDSDGVAKISATRCLERAYEYHAYCGFAPQRVVSTYFYNSDGKMTTAASNYGNPDSSYIFLTNLKGNELVLSGILQHR